MATLKEGVASAASHHTEQMDGAGSVLDLELGTLISDGFHFSQGSLNAKNRGRFCLCVWFLRQVLII